MADSKLRDLSIDFAVKVIKMCDKIKGLYDIINLIKAVSKMEVITYESHRTMDLASERYL